MNAPTFDDARKRAVVQLADGRVGVLVFWPSRRNAETRAPRAMLGGARSVPVAADQIVGVVASSTRRADHPTDGNAA